MNRQDAIYRRLFKHPRMLRDLLACVTDADWLQDLNWAGLQELDTHYVAERLQQRIGDGAWRIPYRSGHDRELYVLLMLEHQSRADTYMALRMATYAGLPDRNLAALLFRLEHSTAIEEIPELLHTLMRVVQGAGFEELNRSLAAYIQHLVLSRAKPMEAVPVVTTLRELAMLISEKPGIWARQWEQEGIQKGRSEGREEGRQEGRTQGRQEGMLAGQAALLERQLTHKFGSLPEVLVRRVRQGTPFELEAWSLSLIDADSLDQVFATKNPDSYERP